MGWKEDPEVLTGIFEVEALLRVGHNEVEIAASLDVSIGEVRKRKAQLSEILREEASRERAAFRAEVLRELSAVKAAAWKDQNLELVRRVLRDVRELLGLDEPARQEILSKGVHLDFSSFETEDIIAILNELDP